MADRDAKDDDGKPSVPAPPSLSFEPPGRRRGAGLPRPSSTPEPEPVEDPLAALLGGAETGLDPEDMRTRPYPSVAGSGRPRRRGGGVRKHADPASDSMTKPIVDANDDDDIASLVAAAAAAAETAEKDPEEDPFDDIRPASTTLSSSGRSKPARGLPPRLPTSIGAAGLPRGIKPPAGVVEAVVHDDTDVLIAEAAAELISLHPEPEPEPKPEPAGASAAPAASETPRDDDGAAAVVVAATPMAQPPTAAAAVAPTPAERSRGLPLLWIGLGATAAVAIAFVLLRVTSMPGDQPPQPNAAASTLEAKTSASGGAPQDPPTPEPAPVAAPVAERLDVGSPRLDLGQALDLGGGDTDAVAQLEGDTDAAEPDEGAAVVADASNEATNDDPDRGDRGAAAATKPPPQRRKSGAEARKPPPPKRSGAPKPAPAGPTASSLLADAKKAFSKGRSSEAYSLASKSNSKKRSESALRIMARAACRMKSKSKAKSAFAKLSVGGRKGIRSECRDRGIRLGL